ncbi:MAG: gstB 3 [Herminiimonas sp.]|nr:gstB 3 [Herminiimonas sp.]MDB5855242.1 gstB 3 [Herminiimonas sp.]
MLTLWGRTNSINVQKVLWTLAEVATPFELVNAGREFGLVDTPQYLAMNPNGKVPTLRDGELVLWESNAIVRYLCARYGDATLYPTDLAVRADGERWMDWCVSTVTPEMTPLFFGLIRTPPEQRNQTEINAAAIAMNELAGMVDAALDGRDYLAGSAFSMADIPLGCYIYRWSALPIERSRYPNLEAWQARLAERDAFRRHVMLPLR